jgi:hypothetical protein
MLAGASALAQKDAPADRAVEVFSAALNSARSSKPASTASVSDRIMRLVKLDEITRQYLFLMDDPALDVEARRAIGSAIGAQMYEQDLENTAELKKLIPAAGWFRNSLDGKQVTHGAWLIMQHSGDIKFMSDILRRMEPLLTIGEVDARDYALTYDRVARTEGREQRFGSQAVCGSNGKLEIEPVENLNRINQYRAEIGWSQTFEETQGDLQIGKFCQR